jgi:hypothetical protein
MTQKARMNKSCCFVLQYNTEALVLVLQYYLGKRAILKQYRNFFLNKAHALLDWWYITLISDAALSARAEHECGGDYCGLSGVVGVLVAEMEAIQLVNPQLVHSFACH